MRTAFVTGGSGFVGKALLRRLRELGVSVRALARSDEASACVTQLGATAVRGDLSVAPPLEGSDVVFHVAGLMDHTRGLEALRACNVHGTERMLAAAKSAGVRRFVHVSTAAVYSGGRALQQATEDWPLPGTILGAYPRTKAEAEAVVRASGVESVILRPAFCWGPGDHTTLPQLVEQVRTGRFSWIDGGRFPFSTCHVDNLAEALVLAADHGPANETYFVTDGAPVELRAFFTALLEAHGVTPSARNASLATVLRFASLVELPWKVLPLRSEPPTHLREVALLLGRESTVSAERARRLLGYVPRIGPDEGLRAQRSLMEERDSSRASRT